MSGVHSSSGVFDVNLEHLPGGHASSLYFSTVTKLLKEELRSTSWEISQIIH